MTREEQLDWLYRLRSEIYVYMPKEWLIPMNNALDMTIKALEQKPFINKPCIANKICHEDKVKVLDKIRAEIEQTAKDYDKFDDYRRVRGLWIALDIIDKYKAESEDKE